MIVDDKRLAELLRAGADAVVSVHQEFCISSDCCRCFELSGEMAQVADAFDLAPPLGAANREARDMSEPMRWKASMGGEMYCVCTTRDPVVCLYGFSSRERAEEAVIKLNALSAPSYSLLAVSPPSPEQEET